MARIEEKAKSIVLENRFAEIYLSKSNSLVEKIIDKKRNLWYNMGSCIDLLIIYLAVGTAAYILKRIIVSRCKK